MYSQYESKVPCEMPINQLPIIPHVENNVKSVKLNQLNINRLHEFNNQKSVESMDKICNIPTAVES